MTIFKRQSDQMKAVVAEALEALEATKEVVTKIKSQPPEAATVPAPPMPETVRPEPIGRYVRVPRPTPRLAPSAKKESPPLPKAAVPPPLPVKKAPLTVPRPAMRPAPMKKPSPSDPDDS